MSTDSNQVSSNDTASYIGAIQGKDLTNQGFYLAGNTYYFQQNTNVVGTTAALSMGLPRSCGCLATITVVGMSSAGAQFCGVETFNFGVNAAGAIVGGVFSPYASPVPIVIAGWGITPVILAATATSPASFGFTLTTTTAGNLSASGTLVFSQNISSI